MARCTAFVLREAFSSKLKALLPSTQAPLRGFPAAEQPRSPDNQWIEQQQRKKENRTGAGCCLTSLPIELQLEIFKKLRIEDLLVLRSVNKSVQTVIDTNDSYLARQYIKYWPQDSISRLYLPQEGLTLACLSQIELKWRIADKLCCQVAADVVDDLLSSPSHTFLPEVRHMAIGLVETASRRGILTLFHFFEQYKEVKEDPTPASTDRAASDYLSLPLLKRYTDNQLLLANQMCDLLLKMLTLPSIVPDSSGQSQAATAPNNESSFHTINAALEMWGFSRADDCANLISKTLPQKFSKMVKLPSTLARLFQCIGPRRPVVESSKSQVCEDLLFAFIRPATEDLIKRGAVAGQESLKLGADFVEEILYDESSSE